MLMRGNATRKETDMTADQPQDDWDRLLNESDDESFSQRTSMRYATVVLDAGPDGFYPDHQAFAERAAITHERIHRLHLLDDGTTVGLYEIRADLDQVAAELEARPDVLHYDIAGTGGGSGLVYEHTDATDATVSLLALLDTFEVVLDLPLVITSDDATRITLIGEETALQRTLEAASEIVAVRLEKTGEYQPKGHDLASTLTDRQHQILRLAVERGYYEVPRRATIEDLANETERSPSTVAAHLQKIEAAILPHAVR